MNTRNPFAKFCQKIESSLDSIEKDIATISDSDVLTEIHGIATQLSRKALTQIIPSLSAEVKDATANHSCSERQQKINQINDALDKISSQIEMTRETHSTPYKSDKLDSLEDSGEKVALVIESLFYLDERVEEARKKLVRKAPLIEATSAERVEESSLETTKHGSSWDDIQLNF